MSFFKRDITIPTFREVLAKTIPSKTERLVSYLKGLVGQGTENISRRRKQIAATLRDNQRITGFAQPKSFDLTGYQTRTQKFFNRLIGGISRFIRNAQNKLNFSPLRTGFTPSAKKYRDALNRVIERSKASMIDLARDLIDNRITIQQFKDSFNKQIRQVHTAAAFIGLRSVTNFTGNALEVLQARIDKQLNFADDFAMDIQELVDKQDGGLTAKQAERIVNSAAKYASAAKSTASDMERQLIVDTYGDREDDERILGMRVLGSNENHCIACPSLAGEWVDADSITVIGDTPCTVSCYCTIVWSRASDVAGETLEADTASSIL